MKKLFVTLLLLFCSPARAELTKCVYLNPAMTCTAGGDLSLYENVADWDATCTDSVGTTEITGVWGCSNQSGASQGETADKLSSVYGETPNTNCWCKMLTPAVSMWVFHSTVSSQGKCFGTCGRLCLNVLQKSSAATFKRAMFSNLGA